MIDKIICPWCGAEMEARAHKNRSNAIGWTKCQNIDCGAGGPIVTGKTAVECANKARAAALRRYTPPAKPLTLAEARARNNKDLPVYVESKYTGLWHGLSPLNGWVVGLGWLRSWVEPDAGPVGYIEEGYGRYWRCWDREPTGEEMEAASWET